MPNPAPSIAEQIADEATEAIFQKKIEMTAASQPMMKSDVRAAILSVAGRLLAKKSKAVQVDKSLLPFGDPKAIPPTPEQVTAYSASIGYAMDGDAWCDFYAAKGWMVGKVRMKDYQATVRNWKTNRWGLGTITLAAKPKEEPRDYGKI